MNHADRRTVIAEVPPCFRGRLDLRDEELRQAQFAYSQTVVAGQRCDFRLTNQTHTEKQQCPTSR